MANGIDRAVNAGSARICRTEHTQGWVTPDDVKKINPQTLMIFLTGRPKRDPKTPYDAPQPHKNIRK